MNYLSRLLGIGATSLALLYGCNNSNGEPKSLEIEDACLTDDSNINQRRTRRICIGDLAAIYHMPLIGSSHPVMGEVTGIERNGTLTITDAEGDTYQENFITGGVWTENNCSTHRIGPRIFEGNGEFGNEQAQFKLCLGDIVYGFLEESQSRTPRDGEIIRIFTMGADINARNFALARYPDGSEYWVNPVGLFSIRICNTEESIRNRIECQR